MPEHYVFEVDDWSTKGSKINATDKMQAIEAILENIGPIIVQHWFYRGGHASDRLVFDDYEEFVEYLNTKAKAGDAFDVWDFAEVCKTDNMLAEGKLPDKQGRVPNGGAY